MLEIFLTVPHLHLSADFLYVSLLHFELLESLVDGCFDFADAEELLVPDHLDEVLVVGDDHHFEFAAGLPIGLGLLVDTGVQSAALVLYLIDGLLGILEGGVAGVRR